MLLLLKSMFACPGICNTTLSKDNTNANQKQV